MIRELLTNLHWSVLPVVGMMLFLSVFVGLLLWVNRKGSNSIYQELAALPLEPAKETNGGFHE